MPPAVQEIVNPQVISPYNPLGRTSYATFEKCIRPWFLASNTMEPSSRYVTVRILLAQYPVDETRGMSRFLPLPTSINAEGPTLLGPLPKYHTSSHISVDFVRFASPVSFRHVLRIFYLSGWSLGRRVVNHDALFPCFVTPSTTSFSHLKESPTVDLYNCQYYVSREISSAGP